MATPSDYDTQWAAQTLGAAAEDPAAARAAFLRRLPAAGFVPPPEWVTAVRTCTGSPVPESEGIVAEAGQFHDREQGLREEIDDFSVRFWMLPPDERRAEWRSLLSRCDGYPRSAAQVRRLEQGLDIAAVTANETADIALLAREVQELFVLGCAARAARRREMLDAHSEAADAAQATARRLRKQYPDVAALEPVYVKRLADYAAVFWRIHVNRSRAHQRKYKLLADVPAMTATSWSALFFFAGLIFVVVFMCGLIFSGSESPEQSAPPSHNRSVPGNPGGP